jgi:hypothetical protein
MVHILLNPILQGTHLNLTLFSIVYLYIKPILHGAHINKILFNKALIWIYPILHTAYLPLFYMVQILLNPILQGTPEFNPILHIAHLH